MSDMIFKSPIFPTWEKFTTLRNEHFACCFLDQPLGLQLHRAKHWETNEPLDRLTVSIAGLNGHSWYFTYSHEGYLEACKKLLEVKRKLAELFCEA